MANAIRVILLTVTAIFLAHVGPGFGPAILAAWVTVSTPENLRIKVRGTTIHVGGNRPRVLTITPAGWTVD